MKLSTCNSCAAPIIWARLPSGKLAPFDSRPEPHGTWMLFEFCVKDDGYHYLTPPEAERADTDTEPTMRHVIHFDTCTGGVRAKASR